MDHLSQIADHAPPNDIEIPYLSELQYDGQDFQSYPQRRGWDTEKLKHGHLTSRSPLEIQCILQTWLYFGLLSQVLGIPVPENEFVTTSPSGRRLITTKQLPGYVKVWRDRVRGLAEEERRHYLSKVKSHLKEASHVLRDNQSQLDEVICLSMVILGSTLDFAMYATVAEFRMSGFAENIWPQCPLLRSRMLDAGWCEIEVSRFENQSIVSSMFFGGTLQRKNTPLGRSHETCSKEICIANNYAENEYRTLHTTDSCCCKPLGPDSKEIIKFRNQHGFPVLQLVRTSEHSVPYIRVLDGNTTIPYVAISHVWSDGLGNVDQNQLPQCQLLLLQEFVNDLWESTSKSTQCRPFQDLVLPRERSSLINMPFWIDTICVPKEQPFRSLAINQMRVIYEKARVVLVLDSELQQLSLQSSWEELLLKISFSGWTRRIWTLQEGTLARALYFRMSDGFFPFSNVHSLALKSLSNTSPLLWECCIVICELMLSKAMTGATKFSWVWNQLRMRMTSHPKHYPVVFACLLGLDVEQVLKAPEDQRMITLIAQVSELPQGILFATGPRINKECYRWAPNLPPTSPINDSTPIHRKQMSLMVVLPGFKFSQSLSGQGTIIFFEDDDDHRLYVLNFNIHETEVRPCDETWPYHETPLGLILQTHWHQLTSELECAALVCIRHETADLIHVKFLCHVEVGHVSPYDADRLSRSDPRHRKRSSATKSDLGQNWAVD